MTQTDPLTADYVIVGGGTAGCVLANRLSEDGRSTVLLIEAGGEAKSLLVQLPVGFARLLLRDRYDWQYMQAPDVSIGGRRFIWSGGKGLGGSSSINGQVYIRGTVRDYDRWPELGAPGWGFADLLPYLRKSETWQGEENQYRGGHGPLSVQRIRDPHPLCGTFLNALAEVGVPTLEDYNAGNMEGAFLTQATQRDGWRCSTEKAYLRPARSRSNLRVITGAETEMVMLEGTRATGVLIDRGGAREQVRAHREVILSAGTMGSPALLMRSGIGPADELKRYGIAVRCVAPEVGQNLQEHPGVSQNKYVSIPTYNSQMGPLSLTRHLWRFMRDRRGMLSGPAVEAMALVRSCEGLAEPDIQIHFLPLAYDIEPDTLSAAKANLPKEPCASVNISLTSPRARGRIILDKWARAVIDHQLLGHPDDIAVVVSGLKYVDRLFKTAAWKQVILHDRRPDPVPTTDEEWETYARANTAITYHPVGTCRMGSDENAVVDTACRVNGIAGLRVVDASVMPSIISANTNATVITIAEKAADIIRGVR